MNLSRLLAEYAKNKPLRIGLIGAGEVWLYGFRPKLSILKDCMLLQVADLNLDKAKTAFARVGWDTKDLFFCERLKRL
jgi:predicted homoserine dehydrogenase-like protein